MRFGDETNWGKGSPVKIGITIEWDSIAFWRIVPHKHYSPEPPSVWNPPPEYVNRRCDRCLRWYVLATGRLHPTLNKLEAT
jgi:hypothetical protein